jgi:hypothetical protein
MADIEKITQWIENGKQLGKVFSFKRSEKTIWSSVGIQKWQNIYKVYVDEIEEENMNAEKYSRDEIKKFNNISDALKYINENTQTNSLELQPCKGQKVFNPSFE